MNIQCFMAERTNIYRRELRRYASSTDQAELCPSPMRYHNAVQPFGDVEAPAEDADLDGNSTVQFCEPTNIYWPVACECGYEFKNSDYRQWNQHRLYRRPGGELFTLREAPAGAMWFADWMEGWRGPDGHSLVVQTPGGEWNVDGPSMGADRKRGPSWTRTGTPPLVTAKPSILMPSYHGFLTNGVLIEC